MLLNINSKKEYIIKQKIKYYTNNAFKFILIILIVTAIFIGFMVWKFKIVYMVELRGYRNGTCK